MKKSSSRRSSTTGWTWNEPIDGADRQNVLNALHGHCEQRPCGRVLVALPVLRWHHANELSREDCTPERCDRFGIDYGIHGYRVFFPLGISSESALSALRRSHTDRWSLMCLLCVASAQIHEGCYDPESKLWDSELFGRRLGEKLRGLRGNPNAKVILPWLYDELEAYIVDEIVGLLRRNQESMMARSPRKKAGHPQAG